jgi:hypothetical protein
LTKIDFGSIITLTTTTGTAMKTNKEKNLEHDARMQAKVRPKPVDYNWEDLQEAIHKMIRNNLNEQT